MGKFPVIVEGYLLSIEKKLNPASVLHIHKKQECALMSV